MKKFIKKILIFKLTFFLIVFLKIYLRLFGFGSLIRLLKSHKKNLLKINEFSYVTKSIEHTSSIIPNLSCLIRASAVKIIFSNCENLKIIIGINFSDEQFKSHAWVTFDNKIILNNDSEIDTYKAIYSI